MTNKKILIVVSALVFTAGCVALILFINANSEPEVTEVTGESPSVSTPQDPNDAENQTSTNLTPRTSPEFSQAITEQSSSLSNNGEPTFDIVNTQQTEPGWYLIKIINTQNPSIGPAWVVMKDQGGDDGLVLVAGPGTSFPPSVPIPDSVRKITQ